MLLAIYPRILSFFDIEALQYSLTQAPSLIAVIVIASIITAVLLAITKKPILHWLCITVVIIISLITAGIYGGIAATLIYVLLAASSEELFKASSLMPLYPNLLSDCILFGICAGLGFAWFENIVYLIQILLSDQTNQ
jgi:RsiW-degrading membrane proteinase PrsW (M82 family)